MSPNAVLRFWFKEHGFKDWFGQNSDAQKKKLDLQIRRKFLKLHREVACGEKSDWRSTPRGRLAEIIVLDQFSRNMFRGTSDAFRYDTLALVLAQEAVRASADKKLPMPERSFMYMPYMHSESRRIHKKALQLFQSTKNKQSVGPALGHKKIIDRFGRYPHRNAALGRMSTKAEIKFMKTHKGF